MAIKIVRAQVNGTWHTLTLNESTGKYEATVTAPGKTSYNQADGADQGTVTVGTGGAFTKSVTLAEGSNTTVVTATDAAGKVSAVTRTVTLDTSVPVIKSATITPNPVDAGKTMVIAVTIE